MHRTAPQITIGMPVYNGAKHLSDTLDNLLAQSYQNFKIIISNNGSTDDSAAICDTYAAKDTRISVIHHAQTSNPTVNFRCVLDHADTPYFMWCAHDDTRDLDFIEQLINALEGNPDAILAFGDIIQNIDGARVPLTLDFVNNDRTTFYKLYWSATRQLHHLYGVWRTAPLQSIKWTHTNWWHDTPLMMAASLKGDFVYVGGVNLHYLYNRHHFFDNGHGPKQIATKTIDLAHLIYQSGKTTAQVGGISAGIMAAFCVCLKITGQAVSFVKNRM